MIKIEKDKRNNATLKKISHLEDDYKLAVRSSLFSWSGKVVNFIRRDMQYGAKHGRVYEIRGKKHVASKAGESPSVISGALKKSVNYKVRGATQATIGAGAKNKVIYAKFLEEGTRKMSPRPYLKRFVDKNALDLRIHLDKNIKKEFLE